MPKISALPRATTAADSDQVPIVTSGETRRIYLSDLFANRAVSNIANTNIADTAAIAVFKLATGAANTVLCGGTSNAFRQIANADISNTAAISPTKIAAGIAGSVLTTVSGTPTWANSGTTFDGTTLNVSAPKVANQADPKVTFQTIPANLQTTNATPTTLRQFSVGSTSGIVIIRDIITASDSSATNTGCWSVDLAYKNVGGTLTQLGSGGITAYGTPSGTLALSASVSSGTVTLTATGIAATTMRWTSEGFQAVAVGT